MILNSNTSVIETVFANNLDELMHLFTSYKCSVVNFLRNNFRENIHYVILKNIHVTDRGRGGNNKIDYMLTNETIDLIKDTYNLKHRYICKIGNSKHVNIIMSLENQTIGFIENSFKNAIHVIREKSFLNGVNRYFVDLYFPSFNLIIECDENNHQDRDIINEKLRENYLLSLGNSIIRFNPNDKLFDLSLVFQEIIKILFSNEIIPSSVIIVKFH
jgi:very-short-patch-repair endonuclease